MSGLLFALRHLVRDLLSSLVFAGAYLTTGDLVVSIALAIAVGVVELIAMKLYHQPLHAMQWLSLGLVIVLGGAAILFDDPRFAMFKPVIAYLAIGTVMLKPGWMLPYMPPKALELGSDVAFAFGYLWAALMFVTAGGSLIAIHWGGVSGWATYIAVFPLFSKLFLFAVQFLCTRVVVRRRRQLAGNA